MKLYTFLLAAALAFLAPSSAQTYRPDADYIVLEQARPTRVQEGEVEIIEFFNYACPHCFNLQGPLARWAAERKPAQAVLVQQPVPFSRYDGHFARVFYTLDALGVAHDYGVKVYDAIHVQRNLINSQGRFLDWLEEQGINRDKAEAVYNSFAVNTRAERAAGVAAAYGVNSTPQIVVAGKYLVSPHLSGNYQKLFDVVNYLVAKETPQ